MEKDQLLSVYNTLSRYRREYIGASEKKQSKIEESVRKYAETLPGDLYIRLNQGSANGLFRATFFQGDIDRSLCILEKELGK